MCHPAGKEYNGEEAKELFDKVFTMVFGPEGSSLSYSVNIVGLYKTQGDVVYKDKKISYEEKRFAAWEDGKVAYMVDKEKKRWTYMTLMTTRRISICLCSNTI